MRWFKHDADARNSLKLRKVRRKYGAEGYAIYWFCLEAIAYEVDKDNLTFNLKEDAETIGFELSIQEKQVEEIMRYMVEIGLFESSNNTITCLKLAERLDKSMTNSPKMRAWLESQTIQKASQNVMTLDDSVNTCAELDKTRLDKNRKEIKESNKSSNEDEIKFLESITNHWNEIMTTQPKINLLDKTKVNEKRVKAVKKICKDYPDYKDHEYFLGYFVRLAQSPTFDWQRTNKQVTFDQALNLDKFARNIELLKMEETA